MKPLKGILFYLFIYFCITLPNTSLKVSDCRCTFSADVPRLDPALLCHVSISILKHSVFLEADCTGEDGETGQITASSWLDSVSQGVFNCLCSHFLLVPLKPKAAPLEKLSVHNRKWSKKSNKGHIRQMISCICKNLYEVLLKQHIQMQSSHLGKLLKGGGHLIMW